MVNNSRRKGNIYSTFSHSSDPNCIPITTIPNSKYYIGIYCIKNVKYGKF